MVNPYGRRQFQLALSQTELAFVGASDKESIARIGELHQQFGSDGWQMEWLKERKAI